MRDALGISPGTEVEIHERDGKAIVEPEDDPDGVIDRIEQLVEEIPDERDHTPYDDLGPQSRAQVDAIRRQATDKSDE